MKIMIFHNKLPLMNVFWGYDLVVVANLFVSRDSNITLTTPLQQIIGSACSSCTDFPSHSLQGN